MDLVTFLVQAALVSGGAVPAETDELTPNEIWPSLLAAASPGEWQEALSLLQEQRLSALVYYGLRSQNWLDLVPDQVHQRLAETYQYTGEMNRLLLLTLSGILQAMDRAQIFPIIWKGVVLADSFYPDPGTRPMGDLDFAIAPEDLPVISQVFQQLGFQPLPQMATSDAIYFRNSLNILCDIHHRVHLFEGKADMALVTAIQPQCMPLSSMRVLEPNAMVVHLQVHLERYHQEQGGPLLGQMVDLAFLLQHWGNRLQPERIQALMPDDTRCQSLWRTLRYLQDTFQVPIPPDLQPYVATASYLSLEQILADSIGAAFQSSRLKEMLTSPVHRP